MKEDIERAINHMLETNGIRKELWHMDRKVENLSYGIRQGDDSVIVGDIVVNMEGPYPLKIGRKTGLIHTCSDIVVMGAKPIFALNSMQLEKIEDAREIVQDIKKQSQGLGVPMIGGNTQLESNLKPCISFTVIGKLLGKPIPDSGVKERDRILMLGEIVEGSIGERVHRANVKFSTFLELIQTGVEIHASKDASRGGWFGNMAEMLVKSKKGVMISSIPYPRITRYMGTYLIGVPKKEVKKVVEIAAKHRCPIIEVGTVVGEHEIRIGDKIVVDRKRMEELIRGMPYRKPKFCA